MKKVFFLLVLLMGKQPFAETFIYPDNLDFKASSRKHIQSIRVINKSNKRQTYHISMVDLEQNSNGDMIEVNSFKKSAKEYLKFSPRQFTLEPNVIQTVNVSQGKIADAPDDEFFSFLQIKETKLGASPKNDTQEIKNLSLEFIPLSDIHIPIKILKETNLISDTDVDSLTWEKNQLDVLLKRTGNISSDVNLALLDNKKNEISRLNSVRIFAPNDKLNVKVPIKEGTIEEDGILKLEDASSKKEILMKPIHKQRVK